MLFHRAVGFFLKSSPLTITMPVLYKKSFCSELKPDITIYQYRICPFCCRVKALLDYSGIDYMTVEVNPITKQEIKFSSDHKKVPIANINGKVVADSGNILNEIRELYKSKSNTTSKALDALFSPDSEKWMEWSEKKLAVMLYPNITRNFDEAWEAFEYANDVSSWSMFQRIANRNLGPIAMYLANSKIKKKYGIVDERSELRSVLKEWTNELGSKPFMNGVSPTLPDLMVYGVLKSIATTTTFEFVMEDVLLKDWYLRVDALVQQKVH